MAVLIFQWRTTIITVNGYLNFKIIYYKSSKDLSYCQDKKFKWSECFIYDIYDHFCSARQNNFENKMLKTDRKTWSRPYVWYQHLPFHSSKQWWKLTSALLFLILNFHCMMQTMLTSSFYRRSKTNVKQLTCHKLVYLAKGNMTYCTFLIYV